MARWTSLLAHGGLEGRASSSGATCELTTLTRIFRLLRSVVQVRANDRRAALVALYTLRSANPFEPTTDDVRIDAPSRRRVTLEVTAKPALPNSPRWTGYG